MSAIANYYMAFIFWLLGIIDFSLDLRFFGTSDAPFIFRFIILFLIFFPVSLIVNQRIREKRDKFACFFTSTSTFQDFLGFTDLFKSIYTNEQDKFSKKRMIKNNYKARWAKTNIAIFENCG